MSTIIRRPLRLITILGALSLTTLAASPAQSHGVLPGFAGRGLISPTCFSTGAATLAAAFNTCGGGDITSTQRAFVVPFQTQNNANLTFRARVRGNGATATTCRGVVVSSNNVGVASNPQSQVSTTFALIDMGTMFVSSSSTAHLWCDVAQNAGAGGGAVLSTAG